MLNEGPQKAKKDKSSDDGPSSSPETASKDVDSLPCVTQEKDGTNSTGEPAKPTSNPNPSLSDNEKSQNKQATTPTDDAHLKAQGAADEMKETPSKASPEQERTSHDSTTTGSTGKKVAPDTTQGTNQTEPKQDDGGDSQEAVNAIFWEAGLSKPEVVKRTKLDGNDVIELDLEKCEELTKIHPKIGRLTSLRTLNLSGCKELVTLPPEIQHLTNLSELYLTNCHKLMELPPEIGKLSGLTEFYLTNCLNLKFLPPEVGKLENLNELYLTGCKLLEKLPPEVGRLSKLTELKLVSCTLLTTLPPEIGRLGKLTKLDLRLCEGLVKLPSEIGQLHKLTAMNLTGCIRLVELPEELGNLKKLTELILKDCKELVALPAGIAQLSQLTELNCDGCIKLKKLAPELRQLHSPSKSEARTVTGSSSKGSSPSKSSKDKRSGLDIMRIAAAHLEKVPEAPRGSALRMSMSPDASLLRSEDAALALDEKYFENIPDPPAPDEVITKIGEHDVLCGRGGETNHWAGNVAYRYLVKQHQLLYIEAKRLDKPRIALKIVNMVRKNGGRFLKKEGDTGTWRDVGNQKAREKTSQTLREGAPDLRDPSLPQPPPRVVLPYGDEQFPNGDMLVDPAFERMIQQKRKSEQFLQQPSRKKQRQLPIHRPSMYATGEHRAITDEDVDMQTDPSLADPMLRGPRLQILKARPPDAAAIGPTAGDTSIVAPTGLDVVYGKGKAIQDHVGNIRFRKIVDMHRQSYHSAFRRADKTQISKDIVQWIRSMGGRFLQLDFSTGIYHDVGDECARDKVSHALRSRKDANKRPQRPTLPKTNFIPPEERERVMAYTMGIVRNLQNQDQDDVERTYYQQSYSRRDDLPTQKNPAPALVATGGGAAVAGATANGGRTDMVSSAVSRVVAAQAAGEKNLKQQEEEKQQERDTSDWPLHDVAEPHENDVLYGRGGKSNHHPGNKKFRQAVKNREWDYLSRKNKEKQLVAMEIVREWRNQNPPGRFLKKDDKSGLWHDVGDQKAREKTSQAFRENAPHHPPPMYHAMPTSRPLPPMNMRPGADLENAMLWRHLQTQYPQPAPARPKDASVKNLNNKAEV